MIIQALVIALLFAEPAAAPLAKPAPATAPAPAPQEPPPLTAEQVIARIDELMAPWKGKSGERLRGQLGLSEAARTASDGEVVFWARRAEATACGIGAGGAIQCGTIGGMQCRLGIAFEKDGKVKSWKASGEAEACELFLEDIGAPL